MTSGSSEIDQTQEDENGICGDLGIRIDRNGRWFYHGSPINRKEMVCLFASVMKRTPDGRYWLETPMECGTIQVDDVPFMAVEMFTGQCGRDLVISFRTNVDDLVTLDADHPLRMVPCPQTGETIPYITVRDGLDARLTRAVYYELAALGFEERIDDKTQFGFWSSGTFFSLGEPDEAA